MWYPEEIAAVALAVALAGVLLAKPALAYRYLRMFGLGGRPDPGGDWGSDPEPSDRATLAIRLVGIGHLLLAAVIATAPWWRDAVSL